MSAHSLSVSQAGMSASAASMPLPVPPPPPPPPPGGLRRRPALLGSLAAILAAPVIEHAAAAPHPDAGLVALCAEHRDLERRKIVEWNSRPRDITWQEEAAQDAVTTDPMIARQGEIAIMLGEMRARTAEGLLAWLVMVATFDTDLAEFDPEDDFSGRMLACICRDAQALHAAGTGPA